ncbi:unnamed protein product, partial [Ectocarpus sp. 12 AP-2014]
MGWEIKTRWNERGWCRRFPCFSSFFILYYGGRKRRRGGNDEGDEAQLGAVAVERIERTAGGGASRCRCARAAATAAEEATAKT